MTPIEFVVAFSIMPIGGLMIAAFVYWINRREMRRLRERSPAR